MLRAGDTIGDWTIERALGEGAMGSIYRARHHDGRVGALKVLKILPEISVSRGDVQKHMASKAYSETKARYIERWLFDELVSNGVPLRLEDFDVVE